MVGCYKVYVAFPGEIWQELKGQVLVRHGLLCTDSKWKWGNGASYCRCLSWAINVRCLRFEYSINHCIFVQWHELWFFHVFHWHCRGYTLLVFLLKQYEGEIWKPWGQTLRLHFLGSSPVQTTLEAQEEVKKYLWVPPFFGEIDVGLYKIHTLSKRERGNDNLRSNIIRGTLMGVANRFQTTIPSVQTVE